MSEVKRYDMSGYGDGMIEVPDGAFAYLEDHQSELAALREENERLKSESFEELYNAAIDELDALREELASYKNNYVTKMAYNAVQSSLTAAEHDIEFFRKGKNEQFDRAEAAEQRNAAIVGKVTKCKECGSDDLFWFAQNTVPNGIQQNRLSTHDVKCVFVLGCNNCSETLKLVSADKIAEQMTATLKPTESGASDE